MNSIVLNYLQTLGYKLPKTDMYDKIEEWRNWYNGYVEKFHSYKDSFGTDRKMFYLGMAKQVCEDWASIIYAEKDEIKTDVERNEEFIKEKIKELNLVNELKECIEMASWSGTCAGVIRLKNISVENGVMVANEKTEYDLVKVSADKIIPLRIEHGKIIDCAFTSETIDGERKVIYIEIHQLKDDGYEITNKFIDAKTGKEIIYETVLRNYKTNSSIPLFAILMPPKLNTIENNLGLGISVYANAIPQLQGCDITYNNFVMDYYLGGKKIIYNKKLIKYKTITVIKDDGTKETRDVPVYPDDITKQQFMQVGDELNSKEDKELIHEYNPELRTEENEKGIQYALNLLGFKCGLGTKYYEFNEGRVVTATQYSGDRQDLMKNAKKYRDNLNVFVQDLIRGILLLGRNVYNVPVTEECNVEIANADGILVSDEEIKDQYIKEISMGLRSPEEYRMKFFGETEEEAKKMIKLVNGDRDEEL